MMTTYYSEASKNTAPARTHTKNWADELYPTPEVGFTFPWDAGALGANTDAVGDGGPTGCISTVPNTTGGGGLRIGGDGDGLGDGGVELVFPF